MFDKKVMKRIEEHAAATYEVLSDPEQMLFIALQGSQNYDLAYEGSDVDSKCIILPLFKDIVYNKKPISTTHIMENEEHIDLKDIRLMFDCFRKQNINFIEILFSEYNICNENYKEEWSPMIENRELIARYNPYRAVKCIKGMALEKYHALKHPYPAKKEILEQFGYDPKQLHHIFRMFYFLEGYSQDYSYIDCLKIKNKRKGIKQNLLEVKKGKYNLKEAEYIAESMIKNIEFIADNFCSSHNDAPNEKVENLLGEVKYNILKKAFKKEICSK